MHKILLQTVQRPTTYIMQYTPSLAGVQPHFTKQVNLQKHVLLFSNILLETNQTPFTPHDMLAGNLSFTKLPPYERSMPHLSAIYTLRRAQRVEFSPDSCHRTIVIPTEKKTHHDVMTLLPFVVLYISLKEKFSSKSA